MDSAVMLLPEDRSQLIRETAGRMGLNPSAVEKDFWVVWVLGCLFSSDFLADKILFKRGYLRPEIRLEIGPMALWVPNARYEISSYVAEVFPDLFESPTCHVNVIKAERTFWEKATILHAEAFRPAQKPHLARYSRHWKCSKVWKMKSIN